MQQAILVGTCRVLVAKRAMEGSGGVRTLNSKKPRRSSLRRAITLAALATCCALTMSACATVAPYERERLAKRDMQLERNPDASAGEEHATAYREGSSGGGSSSGGGCGCN